MTDLYEFRVEWPSTYAQSVIVTGDFDQWSRSLSLLRSSTNNHFTGTIKVPYGCPTRYKFIVDGEWKVRQEEPTELSPEGFLNNVCYVPLKGPLEEVKPKSPTEENGTLISQGNGHARVEDTGNDKLNVIAGQTEDTTAVLETTSSQPLDKPMDIPAPTTSEPTTSPTNDATTNSESNVTQPPNATIAPIIPIPIVPVNAKENCTIDPTKAVSNEDNIGTFVGVKLPRKDDDKKVEEEEKGEGEVRHPSELPVTSPPVIEAPKEPPTEVVVKEADAVPVQGKTPTPASGEVKEEQTSEALPGQENPPTSAPGEVKEDQMAEAVPVQENTPTPAPEEVKEEKTLEALPVQEETSAPADPATAAIGVKTEGPEETKEKEEPKKEEEPQPESWSATPTPDGQSTPKPPSRFVEGANGHTRNTSDTSTAVKTTSSPTTSSTAPGTTLAESTTSGSSALKNQTIPEPENKSSPGGVSGGDAKEFGVKEGKGSTKHGKKKRTSSIFGSLRKLFHHEKDKKANGSS